MYSNNYVRLTDLFTNIVPFTLDHSYSIPENVLMLQP